MPVGTLHLRGHMLPIETGAITHLSNARPIYSIGDVCGLSSGVQTIRMSVTAIVTPELAMEFAMSELHGELCMVTFMQGDQVVEVEGYIHHPSIDWHTLAFDVWGSEVTRRAPRTWHQQLGGFDDSNPMPVISKALPRRTAWEALLEEDGL